MMDARRGFVIASHPLSDHTYIQVLESFRRTTIIKMSLLFSQNSLVANFNYFRLKKKTPFTTRAVELFEKTF